MAKVYWEVAIYKLTDAGYTQDTDLQSVIAKVDTAIVNGRWDTIVSEVETIKDNYFTGVTFTDTGKAAILEDCINEIITNGIDYDTANSPEDPYVVAFGL